MLNKRLLQFMLLSVCSFALIANAEVEKTEPRIMVSIKPLAFIYSALRPESGHRVDVLMPANRNIHDFSLNVKDLKSLQQADVLFWLGPENEPFIGKLQQRLGKGRQWVSVTESTSHAWLDLKKLPAVINKMVIALVKIFPQESERIQSRAEALLKQLRSQQQAWQQKLVPYQQQAFLLGHNAFLPFAENIGLHHAELYRAGHDHGHAKGGMHELLEIHQHLKEGEIHCAMQEPDVDFSELVARYPSVTLGYVEPMGAKIAIEPTAYLEFFNTTADAFYQCLNASK